MTDRVVTEGASGEARGGGSGRIMAALDTCGASLERILRSQIRVPGPVPGVVLALAAFLLFLPGFATLPPLDRDEASFAQSSRQMVQSGDFVDIRLGDGTRYKKPVGIYWMQAAAARVAVAVGGEKAQHDIATYRAVSLAAAILSVLLTARIASVLAGGGASAAGAVAGVVLAAAFLTGAEARLAKTDATLMLSVLAMMLPLARAWMGVAPNRIAALAFWAALGASVLVKGPIGPMTVGLAVAALCLWRRDTRWLSGFRPLPGLALAAVIVIPWYAAITIRSGWAFWDASLGRDLIGKVAEGQESHGAPPGTYLALLWLTFWPGSVLLALSLPALRRLRKDPAAVPAMVFCLAWALPTWVVFEAVATKLIHYVLPVYPALAILAALGWRATQDPLGSPVRRAVAAVLLALPGIAAGAVAVLSLRYGGPVPVFAAFGIPGMALSAIAFWRWARAGLCGAAAAAMLPLGFCLSLALYPTLARVPALWPSAAMGRAVAAFDLCAAPAVIVTGYAEPSALFTLGADVLAPTPEAAVGRAAAVSCALVFVGDRVAGAFDARAAALGLRLTDRGRVEGTNLGSGKAVGMRVLAKSPG